LPLRWRLALVSFGLLLLLLTALGVLISATEEQTLLASQASVLRNEGTIAQHQFQATKLQPGEAQILTFPTMSKEFSASVVSSIHASLGQNVGVVLLTFTGNVLATDTARAAQMPKIAAPVVMLDQDRVQQWLAAPSSSPYLLANDSQGRRELVILLPMAGWDKSVLSPGNKGVGDLAGYRKALLQLSIPTTAIDQALTNTRLVLLLGLLVAVSLAAVLTLPLVNLALRPLVEMERVSARIATGVLSLRLVEPLARDEIGRLARAFNEMVARLEAAFARQKRFVADVSHELRTPLTSLGGSLEMLLIGADNGDEETTRRLLGGMYSEVERMQRLVHDLLALARLDEGRLACRRMRLDVRVLLAELCEQVQSLVHGQECTCQVPGDLPEVQGDPDHLRRILLNVIENALKFTPSGGRVDIVASSPCGAYLVLEVRDTGIGIAPAALPHVFERFYRADSSRTRQSAQSGGSGLGLSLARELVEMQNGTITIASQPGAGTTVTIRLPAQPLPSPADAQGAEPAG
jgi:signal transduction histidine kinase